MSVSWVPPLPDPYQNGAFPIDQLASLKSGIIHVLVTALRPLKYFQVLWYGIISWPTTVMEKNRVSPIRLFKIKGKNFCFT